MHFSLFFFALSLLIFTTTEAVIIACQQDSQCPSGTQFCSTNQNICIHKHSSNAACQHDNECLVGKCYDQVCHRSCKEDKDCHHTKEYCSISNYCKSKHCGLCTRHVHCANHQCQLFNCASSNCETALNALQKHL